MNVAIFAPNVHHGGGLVLLAALAKEWPDNIACTAFVDRRAAGRLRLPPHWTVHWTKRSFFGRLRAERQLAGQSRQSNLTLTFHNLPPVFRCRGAVACYLHNRTVLDTSFSDFKGWIRVRLRLERFIARTFRRNVNYYVVQTSTMARALLHWLGRGRAGARVSILQLPFVDPNQLPVAKTGSEATAPRWDFIYVSDGQAHKNHRRLFEAWTLLSERGLWPSLAVTLHRVHDAELAEHLEGLVGARGLNIMNLGHTSHDDVLRLYPQAGAMLFASYAESFGIPLIEARAARLPIVAAELDFVRDMCEPAETFDPHSAMSIARAVERFLGQVDPPLDPLTPADFIERLVALGTD